MLYIILILFLILPVNLFTNNQILLLNKKIFLKSINLSSIYDLNFKSIIYGSYRGQKIKFIDNALCFLSDTKELYFVISLDVSFEKILQVGPRSRVFKLDCNRNITKEICGKEKSRFLKSEKAHSSIFLFFDPDLIESFHGNNISLKDPKKCFNLSSIAWLDLEKFHKNFK